MSLSLSLFFIAIAIATTEADEAIAAKKGAIWGDSGQFWSLHLIWF